MSSVVKRKAQEADEMIRQLAAEAAGEAQQEQAESVQQPEEDQAPEDPPALQVVESEESEGYSAQTDDGGDPRELDQLKRQLEKADQRWKSLQGQINSKDQQIEQLHQLLANMNQASAQQPQTAEASQPKGYSNEDVDAFGEDMIDLVKRVSAQVAAQTVNELQSTVKSLESKVGQVEKVSTTAASASFEDHLEKTFPGWQELNEDPGFISWLQDSQTRLNLFGEAAQAKDAAEVAEFFRLYADKVGWKPKSAARNQKKDQQRRQIAPGKSVSGAAPSTQSQPDEKIWTRTEIANMYANKSSYAADEFAKLEREMAKAMSQNRVDYSK